MKSSALRISLLYLLLGILWIYFSDRLILSFLFNPAAEKLTLVQSFKGIFFVSCTSILLYFLIRKSAASLLKSEKQYRQLFEKSPDPMWICEAGSNRFLAANETAVLKYGFSKEEFLALKPEDLEPERKSQDLKTLYKPGENPEEKRLLQHRKKNGEIFFVEVQSKPTSFEGKEARLITASDVNEKIVAEEKRKDANKQLNDFRYAISSATIVSALDTSGNISWVNENFCRLSQYSSNELIGKSFQVLSSGFHSESYFTNIWETLQSSHSWRGEMKNEAKDGSFFWLDMSIVPIHDKSGKVNQYVTISTDITDKKETEEKLVQREKLLSSLINSQTSFLIRLKEDGTYSYANARYRERFGFNESTILKSSFQDMLEPDDRKRFEKLRQVCLRNPGKIVQFELRTKTKEGQDCWTSWEFTCIENKADSSFEIQGMGLDNTKRKVAEQERKKYEKQLDKVLDSINEAYFTVDRNWKFIKINKQFGQILGIERNHVIGHSVEDTFPEIKDTPLAKKLEEAMTEGVPFTFEEKYSRAGLWLQVSIFPVKEGITGYIRDVSRRKESEKQIKQAIERYNTLTKATFDTIWEWDLASDTLNWNDGIKTNFKYTKFAVPDSIRRWGEKVHPDDYQRVVGGIQETIKKGKKQWEKEYRMLCGDGSYRYIIDRGYVIYDDQNQPLRMIGAIQDIHQQKEYQQEIKKLSLVAEKTQNAVVITDQHKMIEWVNEGFTRLTGWTMEEVVNRKPGKFLQGPSTDPETLEKIRYNLFKKQRFSAELINYTKEGKPYWVRMDISPITDEKGEVIKYISIETDITERKQFEEMLKKQNEKLKEIAWISSHDVRRPVASILGLISLYDMKDPTKPFNQEIITLLNTSTKELDKVIRKIVFKTYEVDEMKGIEQEQEKQQEKV